MARIKINGKIYDGCTVNRKLLKRKVTKRIRKVKPRPAKKPEKKTFHPYTRLPIELKLMIWDFAVQNIPTCYVRPEDLYVVPHEERNPKDKWWRGKHPEPLSPLLRTCHDSRITYLKHYTAWGFYQTSLGDQRAQRKFSYFYVNFNKDQRFMPLYDCKSHQDRTKVVTQLSQDRWWDYGVTRYCHSLEKHGIGRFKVAAFKVYRGARRASGPMIDAKDIKRMGSDAPLTEAELLDEVLWMEGFGYP